ncbi:MAG: hydantoinase B/oxoprolinase family protein [Anaerolineae bacterium]|jgi:N-methylhydantoinase B
MTSEERKNSRNAVDPITMSVVFHRLGAINEEMGITMMRTSRSPIFAEVHDFSCAICDWVPRIVAQVDGVPSHTASSMMAARAIVEKFRDQMKPGDVYMINDPYEGGTHLADATVVKPVYYDGELLFMAINRAHHLDVGGMVAGSYSPEAQEIYHEGIRIPAIRIYEHDEPIQYVLDLLKINTRMPDLFESDVRAQVASCNVAEKRLLEMAEDFGVEPLKEILDAIQDYASEMMRAEIAKIPDGVYEGEAILDDDGFDRRDIKVKCTMEVKGEEVWVDFDGTDPQTTGFINSPFANSCTSVYVALLLCVSPEVPHNEGAYQPIHISAPEGSLVNPLPPAPVASCTLDTACAVLEAMYDALAKALPDRAPAAWNRWCGPAISGIDPRSSEFYVNYAFCGMGGGGAMPYQDGPGYVGDGIDLGGLTAPNIETNELDSPHITEYHELLTDSGGAGKWRGGLGVRYAIRFYDEEPFLAIFGDGVRNPPFGLYGGLPGSTNYLVVNEGTDKEDVLPAKGMRQLKNGDLYSIRSSGGGGWGNPHERDAERVLDDVRNGYVSQEAAEQVYGVVIRDGEIDREATAKLRGGA